MPRDTRHDGPPPTIGHLRSMGLRYASVECQRPGCIHQGEVSFDRLGLADEAVLIHAPRWRRFRCNRCGGDRVKVEPNWRDYHPPGSGAGWRITLHNDVVAEDEYRIMLKACLQSIRLSSVALTLSISSSTAHSKDAKFYRFGRDLLHVCVANDLDFCSGYIAGVVDVFSALHTETGNAKFELCVPRSATPLIISAVVTKWIEAHGTQDQDAAGSVVGALADEYPCETKP